MNRKPNRVSRLLGRLGRASISGLKAADDEIMKSASHQLNQNTQVVQSHRAGTFLGGIEQNNLTEQQVAHYYAILRRADEFERNMDREVEMLAEDANGNPIPLRDQQGNILYEHDKQGNPVLGFDGQPIPKYMKITEEIDNKGFYQRRKNTVPQGYQSYRQISFAAGFANLGAGPTYEINTHPTNYAKEIETVQISSNDVIIEFNSGLGDNAIQSYAQHISTLYYRADKYDNEPSQIRMVYSHQVGKKLMFNRI